MGRTVILSGEPFDEARTHAILEPFYRDGFALVPGVLTGVEVEALRARTEELMADPSLNGTQFLRTAVNTQVLWYTHALDPLFGDILVREPMLSLVEAILGPEPRLCGQNVIRSRTGEGITVWHVDDMVEFPLPDDIPRHDPRIRLPVFWLTAQVALTDIDTVEHGPTQVVRGSHYSGRPPNDPASPSFEGRGPESILCKAGDIYLLDHQTWHRGAPNLSDRPRYLLQCQYAKRWATVRFGHPFYARPLPDHIVDGADERLLRVLRQHPP
ncbi:MAG: phytanoyl-CoA dioxygenase family protein [Candidatus Latescibacteria bacterium]|nr:phytanoyl-CoA dioxygenase family protein [Candidatus Latescibacterota bacterium]